MTFAALAVALKVLIPTGFMAAAEPRNALPFALVLCTGQGAMVVEPGQPLGHDQDGDERPADAPCAFAALGGNLAPRPAEAAVAPPVFVAYVAADLPWAAIQPVPGKGLAAPPPPARGPPSQLI